MAINDNVGSSSSDTKWRDKYPVSDCLGLAPEDFEDETTFLWAMEESACQWRSVCAGLPLGVDPGLYSTPQEYIDAVNLDGESSGHSVCEEDPDK